jgi:hypothetical protein
MATQVACRISTGCLTEKLDAKRHVSDSDESKTAMAFPKTSEKVEMP